MGRGDTTFYETPRNDPRDLIEVEIGDSKQAEFFPQIKVKRFDNEANLSLRLDQRGATLDVRQLADRVRWQTEKMTAEFYNQPVSETHPEGGIEFDVTHWSKPERPYLDFLVNSKDVRAVRQPELTREEIEQGAVRPEHIVGSYALFLDTPRINYVGGKLYRTGKVGHIPRELVMDAKGRTAWTELDWKDGRLRVSLPQDFIDQAEYPIRRAAGATLGYTTAGASNETQGADVGYSAKETTSSAASISSMSVYGKSNFGLGDVNVKMAIWRVSDGARVADSITNAILINATPGWWDSSAFSPEPSLASATGYAFAVIDGGASATYFAAYYDTLSSGSGGWQSGVNYASPAATATFGSSTNKRYSVYATYTPPPSGGGLLTSGRLVNAGLMRSRLVN